MPGRAGRSVRPRPAVHLDAPPRLSPARKPAGRPARPRRTGDPAPPRPAAKSVTTREALPVATPEPSAPLGKIVRRQGKGRRERPSANTFQTAWSLDVSAGMGIMEREVAGEKR